MTRPTWARRAAALRALEQTRDTVRLNSWQGDHPVAALWSNPPATSIELLRAAGTRKPRRTR